MFRTKVLSEFGLLRRKLLAMTFCLFLLVNIPAQAAEGGIATLKNLPTRQISQSIPPPPETVPQLTALGKPIEKVNQEELAERVSRGNFMNQIVVIVVIFSTILILIALLRLIIKSGGKKETKLNINFTPRPASPPPPPVQPQKREESRPQNVTEAVVSFVKHRLKK